MKQSKSYLLFFSFLLFVAGGFVACEEVEEAGKYDNWQQRNEAFTDSIAALATGRVLADDGSNVDQIAVGEMFAILVPSQSTSLTSQYVYCKKLVANAAGRHPNYTGEHATVSTYYYGTLINGDEFDGNFDGYGALDQEIPLPPVKEPTAFDSPSSFSVSGVIAGWTWALQYMREGERWMLYIPWQCAYGSSGSSSGSVLGYSTLTFDIILRPFDD